MDELAVFENDPDVGVLSARLSLLALGKGEAHSIYLSGSYFFRAQSLQINLNFVFSFGGKYALGFRLGKSVSPVIILDNGLSARIIGLPEVEKFKAPSLNNLLADFFFIFFEHRGQMILIKLNLSGFL